MGETGCSVEALPPQSETGEAYLYTSEQEPASRYRCLTEVDNLFANRLADGTYPAESLANDLQNRVAAVKEAASPYAISESRHPIIESVVDDRSERLFMWTGRIAMDAVDVAMSGYDFHQHESALLRTDVEVDEAEHTQATLRRGRKQAFVSPRMTRKDASYEVAKQEHMADDDALRVSWIEDNPQTGQPERVMQAILIRDIPLDAWVSWGRSETNVFGRSLDIDDEDSALGMMRAFAQMDIEAEALPEGVISILYDVLPHISDPQTRYKVNEHINRFLMSDQAELDRQAHTIAERWQQFDMALSESRFAGRATADIAGFVFGLQEYWGDDELALIAAHSLPDGGLAMSRDLEACIETAKQNVLFSSAGVMAGNEQVLEQLSEQEARHILQTEATIQHLRHVGNEQAARAMEAQQSRLVARNNITVGAGCPGEVQAGFKKRDGDAEATSETESDAEDRSLWFKKKGVCRVQSCRTRPGETEVGPCDVCRSCQVLFDAGVDPTSFVNSREQQPSADEAKQKKLRPIVWFAVKQPAASMPKEEPAQAVALAA